MPGPKPPRKGGSRPAQSTRPAETAAHRILLPNDTPVMLVHGTYCDASIMAPMSDFFKRTGTQHPTYTANIPEIQFATGIETVDKERKYLPASQAVLREMGDFRYQVTQRNLRRLTACLNPALSPRQHDTALAEFFEILPEYQEALLPVIHKHLITPIFQRPAALKKGEPLNKLVESRVKRIRTELGKLQLSTEEQMQEIIDSQFLSSRASAQNKELNYRMQHRQRSKNTINIRNITLQDSTALETYLMGMEEQLTQALVPVLAHEAEKQHQSAPSAEALQRRAQLTAQKLMAKIAPPSLVVGHSQGGVAVHTALLNTLNHAPKTAGEALRRKAPHLDKLAGRAVGVSLLLCSPVGGVKTEPEFTKDVTGLAANPLIKNNVKRIAWAISEHDRPAIKEMRENSPFIRQLSDKLAAAQDAGITVISAANAHDSFIDPASTTLSAASGETPPNVLNVQLNMPKRQLDTQASEKRIWEECERLGLSIKHGLLRKLFNAAEMSRLPASIQETLRLGALRYIYGTANHRAVIDQPQQTHQELGRNLLSDPDIQSQVLDTHHFEPFRGQAILVWQRRLQKSVFSQPLPQAIEALQSFAKTYPDVIPRLVENAQEALPLANSASQHAAQTLRQILRLIQRGVAQNSLTPAQAQTCRALLVPIAQAHLAVPWQPALSRQATSLLKKLERSAE